ncbi:hypothetical protein Syun_003549 [Stephania yunnanensis]|uniref:Uncharacterized protein n=1 Tax=Stephania yunnanensis TaxID=152371 RepID=A0AAP0L2Z6_9MAGN
MKRNASREGEQTARERESGRVLTGERESETSGDLPRHHGPPTTAWSRQPNGSWDPHTSFGGVPDTFRPRWSGGGAAKAEGLFRREGQHLAKTEFVVCIQQVLCMGHAGVVPDVLTPELGSEGLRSGDVEFHVGGVVRSMIFVGESETRVRGGDYWEAKLEDEGCMRDLVRFLCFVKNLGRLRRDCGLVIRSRGRWGKCG